MIYSWLSIGIAIVYEESFKKILDRDRDPHRDPFLHSWIRMIREWITMCLERDCNPDRRQYLIDCSLGASDVKFHEIFWCETFHEIFRIVLSN